MDGSGIGKVIICPWAAEPKSETEMRSNENKNQRCKGKREDPGSIMCCRS